MNNLAVTLILFVSNFFRASGLRACRYHPTCSCYAVEAFRNFGFFKACFLSFKRVLSCHPFSNGGYDPLMTWKKEQYLP